MKKNQMMLHEFWLVLTIFLMNCSAPHTEYPVALNHLHKNVLTKIMEDQADLDETEKLLMEMGENSRPDSEKNINRFFKID